jgi:hypothetical protein
MYVKLSWKPVEDENWAIMVVQPAILTYPTMVFYFWLAPQVLWNLCFHPLPVPMAARITKYLNKYVRRVICLIYMSSFYFWSPPLARKMRKTNVLCYSEVCQAILEAGRGRKLSHNGCTAGNFDLPDNGFLLLTCSTGPMESSTGNSYQAEALTNVFRYHTCRSSHPV